jgi:ribonuclease HI
MTITQSMHPKAPNSIAVYTDAACRNNPGPSAIGYAIYDDSGICLETNSKYIGTRTNNVAEYEALLWGMDQACAHCRGSVVFHSDSELIVHQVNGDWRVKKEHLRPLVERVLGKKVLFKSFQILHLPRTNLHIAAVDKMANDVLDKAGF